jgi:hypothetical protein
MYHFDIMLFRLLKYLPLLLAVFIVLKIGVPVYFVYNFIRINAE